MELNLFYLPDVKIDSGESTFASLDVRRPAETKVQPREVFTPGLRSLLDSDRNLPPYSIIVGLCHDGLPFMLNLNDPKSGSILIVGEDRFDAIQMLKVMTLSACLLNNPQDVILCVISDKQNEFAELKSFPHCGEICSPYDRIASEMITEFAAVVEQRSIGRVQGRRMILVIDDLSSCANLISDYGVYLSLKSLIKRGPHSGIWPIISIPSHAVDDTNAQLRRSFGTYIFKKPPQVSPISSNLGQETIPNNTYLADFDVIIGGRLIPIANLSI